MSARTATRLAWSLWAACLALIALALLLDFLRTEAFLADPWSMLSNRRFVYPIYAVLTGMLSLVYPTIGALIVSRLPRNPVGWIFCGVAYSTSCSTSPWPTPITPWPKGTPFPGASMRPGFRRG